MRSRRRRIAVVPFEAEARELGQESHDQIKSDGGDAGRVVEGARGGR